MNKRLIATFLAVLLPLASGCVITGGGRARPGDVTFLWSFEGQTCAQNPDVARVVITIPGERLQNDGSYPCLSNGTAGIVLHDFAAGSYSYTIEAFNYADEKLFSSSGTFVVNGDVRETVSLARVGSSTSFAYLNWRFPANSASSDPNCSQTGVDTVEVQIGSLAPDVFNCADGWRANPGARTRAVTPGTHPVQIRAGIRSSSGSIYVLYRYSGNIVIGSGTANFQEYNLGWAVGGVVLSWRFTRDGGSTIRNCASAGVTAMRINFQDVATGAVLYGSFDNTSTWDSQLCDDTVSVTRYDYLPPGTYRIYIMGSGSGGTYYSNASPAPQSTVQVGVFPANSAAVNVLLYQ